MGRFDAALRTNRPRVKRLLAANLTQFDLTRGGRFQGVTDLLSGAIGSPERVLPSLPAIMRAIRVAISCKNPGVILFACSALRQLATGNKEVETKTMTDTLSMLLPNLWLNFTSIFAILVLDSVAKELIFALVLAVNAQQLRAYLVLRFSSRRQICTYEECIALSPT